jgi:hypothetical protein
MVLVVLKSIKVNNIKYYDTLKKIRSYAAKKMSFWLSGLNSYL